MASLTDTGELSRKSGGGTSTWGRLYTFQHQVSIEHSCGDVLKADENVV